MDLKIDDSELLKSIKEIVANHSDNEAVDAEFYTIDGEKCDTIMSTAFCLDSVPVVNDIIIVASAKKSRWSGFDSGPDVEVKILKVRKSYKNYPLKLDSVRLTVEVVK